MRVLVVDSHDSFVFTLVGYLRELRADVSVVDSDAIDPASAAHGFDAVMLSPGPGVPNEACIELVRAAGVPLLGVCHGHQAIGAAFGAPVTEAPELMHGMVSNVVHDGSALYEGIPSRFEACRYHSLALAETDLPPELVVTARTDAGTVMGIAHASRPIWGVQYHPESVLTEHGYRLLANWLALCGDAGAVAASIGLDPRYFPVQ